MVFLFPWWDMLASWRGVRFRDGIFWESICRHPWDSWTQFFGHGNVPSFQTFDICWQWIMQVNQYRVPFIKMIELNKLFASCCMVLATPEPYMYTLKHSVLIPDCEDSHGSFCCSRWCCLRGWNCYFFNELEGSQSDGSGKQQWTSVQTILRRNRHSDRETIWIPPNLKQIPKMMVFEMYLVSNMVILGVHVGFWLDFAACPPSVLFSFGFASRA